MPCILECSYGSQGKVGTPERPTQVVVQQRSESEDNFPIKCKVHDINTLIK